MYEIMGFFGNYIHKVHVNAKITIDPFVPFS